jgi:DNA-binding NtrC family response regulator
MEVESTMRKKLLVVAENPTTEREWLHGLSHDEYGVDVVADPRVAVQLSERNDYDVALLDESIETRSGIDVFHDLDRRQTQLGGILCSHNPTINKVDSAINAGMKHVVAKPVKLAELRPLLEGVLSESSRTFDERFPKATGGFETEEGFVKGSEMWCETCARGTSWRHKKLALPFCSADCYSRYHSLREI